MDCITAIKARRSERRFIDEPVPSEIIQEIIECGKHAPSAFDAQPWEFTVLTNQQKIGSLLSDRLQMKEYPFYINSLKYAKKIGIDKYQKITPPPLIIAISGNTDICPYIGSLITSLSCCAQNMMLAATSFGLSSCWLYVYDPDDVPDTEIFVKKQLKLHKNYLVLCLLMIGYGKNKLKIKKFREPSVIWTS